MDEAAVVTEALRAVVERGTASYYHDSTRDRPPGQYDWYIQRVHRRLVYRTIPQLSTSVWVGYPNERRSMVNTKASNRSTARTTH